VFLLFLNQVNVLDLPIIYVVGIFVSALGSIYSSNKLQKMFVSPAFADKKCPFCDTDNFMTTLKLYCTNCGAVSERDKEK